MKFTFVEFSGYSRSDTTQRLLTCEAIHSDRIGKAIHGALSRDAMTTDLTEEEMPRALFGEPEPPASVIDKTVQDTAPEIVIAEPTKVAKKKKLSKTFTPRLRVTLRVGNEFEGKCTSLYMMPIRSAP